MALLWFPRLTLLFLAFFLPFAVAKGRPHGGHSSIEVEVAFEFASPIDLSVFSFCVIFAVFSFLQAYILVTRLIRNANSDASVQGGSARSSQTRIEKEALEEQDPGTIFAILLALASTSLVAYWIMFAVYEGLITSSLFDPFSPAFYSCLAWLYQFAETLLLSACLFLLHRRASRYPALPLIITSKWKKALDSSLILWAIIAQILVAVFRGEIASFRTWLSAYYAFVASEIVLATNLLVSSMILWNALTKRQIIDKTVHVIAKRVAFLLFVLAPFDLAVPISDDTCVFKGTCIDFAALNISEVLIYGFIMLFAVGYLSTIGVPEKKVKEDEESPSERNNTR
ncbi:hypothetical protein ONZ45_g13469 [Pleurotus djamor]|nr:hypothetical protein ONZ45_g13469 [Pleurotus djamor]